MTTVEYLIAFFCCFYLLRSLNGLQSLTLHCDSHDVLLFRPLLALLHQVTIFLIAGKTCYVETTRLKFHIDDVSGPRSAYRNDLYSNAPSGGSSNNCPNGSRPVMGSTLELSASNHSVDYGTARIDIGRIRGLREKAVLSEQSPVV